MERRTAARSTHGQSATATRRVVTVGDVSDLLQGGSGDDIIEAIEESTNIGEDTMIAGGGNDIIEAHDGVKDTIDCGSGTDTVSADAEPTDKLAANCYDQ
jgi:RTX calcium-binding nonapeptide repeat (4 copies)